VADSRVQQALNLRALVGRAIRAGSYAGPYSVINTSLTATVWIANNPSVQPGQGTSISPGTSLTWTPTTNEDLYLICGVDSSSTPLGYADVIISFDTYGWQPSPVAIAAAILNSGVIIIDNPKILVQTLLTTSGSDNSPVYDVTHYNSINVILTCLQAGASGGTVTIMWFNDVSGSNGIIASDNIQFLSTTNGYWQATIPCRGSYFQLYYITNTGGTFSVSTTITASYRQAQNIVQTTVSGSLAAPNNLASASYPTIATNAFSPVLFVPPWFGMVNIIARFDGSTALSNSGLLIYNLSGGGVVGTANFISYPVPLPAYTGAGFINIQLALWGQQIGLQANNGSTAAQAITVSVQPVRYNP
jgi:hypothetical protein